MAAQMQSMQAFQMMMNLVLMPLYFLSGAMFPVSSAPAWMRALMVVNPVTYCVDALRNVVFAHTRFGEAARAGGLVRFGASFDVAVIACVAVILTIAAAVSFSRQPQ
jgi:ABC-2 type transport system permease protein